MAKPRKRPADPESTIIPYIGDKVTIPRVSSILEVDQISRDATEVTLRLPGTNLQWFRIKADTLTYVDRKPPPEPPNQFAPPEAAFDAAEVMERIATVQKENLKRTEGHRKSTVIAMAKSYHSGGWHHLIPPAAS